MLYQQTDNLARQYIAAMNEGFEQRLAYIRKLMEYNGQTVTDEVYDSISFSFNVARPVDNAADMENMQIQYNCGAISRQTIIDRSPYTTDTALEIKRIEDESKAQDNRWMARKELLQTPPYHSVLPQRRELPAHPHAAPHNERDADKANDSMQMPSYFILLSY